jgi:hypothetical protein
MPCKHINVGGFGAIVCSRGSKPKPCVDCGAGSTALCDYEIAKGKTCDRAMCDRHRIRVGPNLDYCRAHRDRAYATGELFA